MKRIKKKAPLQTELYERLHTMTVEELKSWYDVYIISYPTHVAPMVKYIAELRGFDVTDWKEFYR